MGGRLSTFIDLFCGIGGFRIALERHGLKCVFSSDIDKPARATYKANHGEEPAGDITKTPSQDIPPHDVLCAGFPCQSFSISGKRKGFDESRGTLFMEVDRIARDLQPPVLFLENVNHFEKHDDGKTMEQVLSLLDGAGYDVFHEVLNSGEFGAATVRKRIFIVGTLKSLNIKKIDWPHPGRIPGTVRQHLRPDLDVSGLVIKREDIRISDFEGSLFGGSDDPDGRSGALTPVRVGKMNYGGQGDRIYSIDGPAITFSAGGGGNGAKTGAYLMDDGTVRKLHPLEAASIMTFPKAFVFPCSQHQSFKQIGNSVVVDVVAEVFGAIRKAVEAA